MVKLHKGPKAGSGEQAGEHGGRGREAPSPFPALCLWSPIWLPPVTFFNQLVIQSVKYPSERVP